VAGAPAIVVALGVGRSLSVFLVSLSLTYLFICEALWGQTLGKRLLVRVRWVHAVHQAITSLEAPPEVTELRRQVLALSGTMVTTIDQAVARAKASPDPAMAFQREVSEMQAREQQLDLRYAQLGLKACAGQPA